MCSGSWHQLVGRQINQAYVQCDTKCPQLQKEANNPDSRAAATA